MTIWGFTGTREGMTFRQRTALLEIIQKDDTLLHGCCIGADAQAQYIAKHSKGAFTIGYPCDIESMRSHCDDDRTNDPKPPLERNKDIVDACIVLIAAPKTMQEEQRSGTWSTVRYARKHSKPTIILEP